MPPSAAPPAAVADFAAIAQLIVQSRQQAVQAVNTALIGLYWHIGERISGKVAAAEWGDGVVEQLARYLAQAQPGLRGFTRANLFRMRQFYEAYAGNEFVAPLVRQIPWTHHLLILGQAKRPEPQLLARADCRIPNPAARQSPAAGQAA